MTIEKIVSGHIQKLLAIWTCLYGFKLNELFHTLNMINISFLFPLSIILLGNIVVGQLLSLLC